MTADVPRVGPPPENALINDAATRYLAIELMPVLVSLTERAEATRVWCAARESESAR